MLSEHMATEDEMSWAVSDDKICSLIFSAFGVPSMMLGSERFGSERFVDEERQSSE